MKAVRHARAARRAECRKNVARQRLFRVAPFGMPLHAERERTRAAHADGLDQPVGRARFDGKPRAQTRDALVVQRIDRCLVRAARDPLPVV